ncbi:MAG: DUF2975 domain-containing protein [Clostridia bacterium]|nr:DUF2975 domain-containing protein [Clostridia bacterium]
MDQRKLSLLLKIVIIGVALCAAAVYLWIVPEVCGRPLAEAGDGEFAHLFIPWLIIISVTALPVAAALVLAWLIAANIGRGRSFCPQNAKYLSVIALLAGIDAAYFFAASVILMIVTRVWHPGAVLLVLFACFAGAAICVAAAALSHYAYKAAALQEQSDLTI